MNPQQVALGLSLKEAGIPIDVSEFDSRLVLQKAVYLLQQAGVHLGYRFRWYLRGPYSPDLTEDIFLHARDGAKTREELDKWDLDATSRERIEKIKALFSKDSDPLATKLELLASVLFLLVTKQAAFSNPEQISTILKNNNKPFEAKDVSGAIEALQTHGYCLA